MSHFSAFALASAGVSQLMSCTNGRSGGASEKILRTEPDISSMKARIDEEGLPYSKIAASTCSGGRPFEIRP